MACIKLLFDLADLVMDTNDRLVERFTDGSAEYQLGCVKSNITSDAYSKELNEKWTKCVNDFMKTTGACNVSATSLVNTGKAMLTGTVSNNYMPSETMVESLINYVTSEEDEKFVFTDDAIKTMKSLASVYGDYCACQIVDIFKFIVKKYGRKYKAKYHGKKMDEVKSMMEKDLSKLKQVFIDIGNAKSTDTLNINDMVVKLTSLTNFSIESELNRLIPDELGSMKAFFIIIIKTYYVKLHPIVWGQMFMNAVNNIFIDTPLTPNEFFQFGSKILLLNSGPFILKILQMIRPVLSPELATKYNLTKLKYPLMTARQVQTIFKHVFPDPTLININMSRSASVGHVCIANRVSEPTDVFVVKIIKPLSIAQSCWEYKTLYNIFPEGCEKDFVKNMLRSNGREMNVNREMENIRRGFTCYNTDYNGVFGISNCDVKLTTVTVRDDIIPNNPWHTFAMSLAPGMPLSDLIEKDMIKQDTPFRSKLHRCLDLLVYKFFFSIVSEGFYHGDLHSGNIFYSYAQNQMTLIDFGAIGEIDLLSGNEDAIEIIDVIIMSLFYNYEGIFDKLTTLLNKKCVGQKSENVDMNSKAYQEKRKYLANLHILNATRNDEESKRSSQYNDYIFGSDRLAAETKAATSQKYVKDNVEYDSIYSYLEIERRGTENIVENKDLISVSEILGNSETMTFAQVLEEIIKFYAISGINVAIKFAEFYELQKAYALLLGVLSKCGYNSYRMGIALKHAILTLQHWKKLRHVSTISHIVKLYVSERHKMMELLESLNKHELQTESTLNMTQSESAQKPTKTKKTITVCFDAKD